MYDAYLFDLDGTLVDTAPDLHLALNNTLAKWKQPAATYELARRWVGHGARVMIYNALMHQSERQPKASVIDEMYLDFLGFYKANIATLGKPYSEVQSVIEHLFQINIPLGIVTNKRYDLTTILLKQLNMSKFFDVVVGGDTTDEYKPSAKPVVFACEKLQTKPEKTLFVGDSRTDVLSARAAGCPIVLVPYGYNDDIPVATLGADKVIKSFAELLN